MSFGTLGQHEKLGNFPLRDVVSLFGTPPSSLCSPGAAAFPQAEEPTGAQHTLQQMHSPHGAAYTRSASLLLSNTLVQNSGCRDSQPWEQGYALAKSLHHDLGCGDGRFDFTSSGQPALHHWKTSMPSRCMEGFVTAGAPACVIASRGRALPSDFSVPEPSAINGASFAGAA